MNLLTKQSFQRLIKRATQIEVSTPETGVSPNDDDCSDTQTHPHSVEDTVETPNDKYR